MSNLSCHFFGHKWVYKNYECLMDKNGNSYDFRQSRRCLRCNEREITFDRTTWLKANNDNIIEDHSLQTH